VPRKGFDTVIKAVAQLAPHRPNLRLVIASTGRDEDRLKKIAADMRAPVTFLGRVPHDDLPALYGSADVFSMMCRNRWGGLEQEGFGIVFVEAASCGVPQIAGDSGGAAEAVLDVDILDNPELRSSMAIASRERALSEFNYDVLANRLGEVLQVGQ
jgi:phosphatidylinositol alpha-1,6-mannosyltransferase